MELLKISDVDFTDYIIASKYSINNSPSYTKWTDANYVTHREKNRDCIKGSITFYLPDDGGTVYSLLQSCIALATDSTTLATAVTLYVNNEDEVKEVNAFCDLSPDIERVTDNGVLFDEFSLTIEER